MWSTLSTSIPRVIRLMHSQRTYQSIRMSNCLHLCFATERVRNCHSHCIIFVFVTVYIHIEIWNLRFIGVKRKGVEVSWSLVWHAQKWWCLDWPQTHPRLRPFVRRAMKCKWADVDNYLDKALQYEYWNMKLFYRAGINSDTSWFFSPMNAITRCV